MTTDSDEQTSRPAAATRSADGVLTGAVLCPVCHQHRGRGVSHRCAAPGLVVLPAPAHRILDALRAAGGRPLVVGGAVRDALRDALSGGASSATPKDVDIEVLDVDELEQLRPHLARVARVDDVGASFGILVATVGGVDFDISVARERSTAGGETAASSRRDFTANALGWDYATGELVDPWGGAADVAASVLRRVGPSFSDDPLRPLRAVQFVARFGWRIDEETLEACRDLAPSYGTVPRSRVWGEWKKLATRGIHISRAVQALEDMGWLSHFPALAAARGVPQDPVWHPEGDVLTHLGLSADAAAASAESSGLPADARLLAVLGALVHDVGKPYVTAVTDDGRITSYGHDTVGDPVAQDFLTGIGSPHVLRDRIGGLVAEHMCHVSTVGSPTKAAVRRLVRRLDRRSGVTILDWARVVDADVAGRGPAGSPPVSGPWVALATELGPSPRKSLLTGRHLMSLGYRPGPQLGVIIAAAVEAQDDGLFDDEEGAVAWFVEQEVPRA
ncbi:CCA tRNA nucleotidyltransferase [Frigoribacterium sp. PvP032]|uniref:CCA tRNA nucleotidyltransferase n=1 Tax=Frigoribacterium sp. PvP032 TaxID=2806589 RepID=UPI001AE68C7A|nr:CCA tRNA nucleotidyltransferase [Frigoribacterium sp. PvP032]MBP1190727.1 tRNA nucleotidyltransferase (CCA-adding enzyme) [Frigoribacterium sp. PvP032]